MPLSAGSFRFYVCSTLASVALVLSDYLPETAELRIRHRKGQKGRVCYMANGAKLALDAWLATRGPEPGPLFWPADGRGRPWSTGA